MISNNNYKNKYMGQGDGSAEKKTGYASPMTYVWSQKPHQKPDEVECICNSSTLTVRQDVRQENCLEVHQPASLEYTRQEMPCCNGVESKKGPRNIVLWPSHALAHVYLWTCAHAHRHIKQIKKIKLQQFTAMYRKEADYLLKSTIS